MARIGKAAMHATYKLQLAEPDGEPRQPTRTTQYSSVTFLMSVVLLMEVIDSNYNQHLLFQHIPLVKGNDDFPARDNSDTDMNLDTLISSFSHCKCLQVNLSFGFCLFVCLITIS